jgi:hypothetical protein
MPSNIIVTVINIIIIIVVLFFLADLTERHGRMGGMQA